MFKIANVLTIQAILLTVVGMGTGCGGGPIHKGGLGIFSPKLPDEAISIGDLPQSVRTQVEAAISGKKLESVSRNARSRDGRWYYTIAYSDKIGGTKQIIFWKDGSLRTLQD